MDTEFSIEWTFDDGALYERRPDMLPAERTRTLYFRDAAEVWVNLIRGWPGKKDGSPRTLKDGSRFRIRIRAVFETLKGGNPEDKARVDADEVVESVTEDFPTKGTIRIDLADIDELIGDRARFKQTIVHEIGHVLGLGTLFDRAGLVADKDTNPVYTGAQGKLAFAALLGMKGESVPVPLQAEPRGSTPAYHWDEKALALDIMSPRLDKPFAPGGDNRNGLGQNNVISTVSAGALVDLGYLVRMERADRVPASMERSANAAACGNRPPPEPSSP